MGKKLWIAFAIVCIVVVISALVLMIVLVPQVKSSGMNNIKYESIAKQEYTYSGLENKILEKDYKVTSDAVSKGKKTNKYTEGNINPFTPKEQVTIYNEPTLKEKTKGSTLSPSDK